MDQDIRRQCFVVGPIGPEDSASRTHSDWVLDGIILPVFASHFPQFLVHRSDRIAEPGMIDAQMINHLIDDDIVIADMSELNANAFYEIGIRHMAQKPIIHMFLNGTEIPFDVGPYRAISFGTTRHRDIEAAKSALRQAVERVIADEYKVENPVTRARGALKIQENATPAIQLLLDRINSIETKFLNTPTTKKTTITGRFDKNKLGSSDHVVEILRSIVKSSGTRFNVQDGSAYIFLTKNPTLIEINDLYEKLSEAGFYQLDTEMY